MEHEDFIEHEDEYEKQEVRGGDQREVSKTLLLTGSPGEPQISPSKIRTQSQLGSLTPRGQDFRICS